ncbi:MAG: hypothetical protein AAGF47_04590 [Planctomycetota bacterium]
MRHHRHNVLVLTAAAGLASGLAAGPTAGQAADDPELDEQSLERATERLLQGRSAPPGVRPISERAAEPVRPHQPAVTESGDSETEARGRLLPEGSFLASQAGTVVRGQAGALVFVPEIPADGDGIRSLVILPSQSFARLQQVVPEGAEPAAEVLISGRALLYRGVNYLRVTAIEQLPPPEQDQTPSQADPNREDSDTAAPPSGLDAQTRALLEQLEQARTGVRGVLAANAAQSASSAQPPVPEGRTLFRRRARLIRQDTGELAVAFDTESTEEGAAVDPPLVVAPCSWLEIVEDIVERHGDSIAVTVSGQTLAHAGVSYLLPTSLTIDRPSELSSRQ